MKGKTVNAPLYGALAANVAELINTLNQKIRIRTTANKNKAKSTVNVD